ncbi:MAG: adenine phosphoribosyltransferase [Candidatus Omnitrophota bacterium]
MEKAAATAAKNIERQVVDNLKGAIRNIPDFPKKGILFRDITTLLKDGQKFRDTVKLIARKYKDKNINKVVAIEARGFIFGAAVAYELGAGFVPVRKKGKLPAKVAEISYDLEYGQDTLQMHQDAICPQDKVLIVDDLLATGGTARAVCQLLEKFNAQVAGIDFLIELTALKGREKLSGYPVNTILTF